MDNEIIKYCYFVLVDFQKKTGMRKDDLMFVISDDLKGNVEGNRGNLLGVDVLFTKDINNILIAKKYHYKGE